MATIEELGLQPRTNKTNGLDKLHRLGIGYVNEELDRAPEPDYSFIPTPQKESPEDFSAIPLPPQKVKPGQHKDDTTEKVREYYSAPPTRFDKIIMGSDAAEMVFGDLATFGAIQPDTEERLNVLQKSGAKAAGSAWDLLLDSVGYASALAGRDDIAKNISDIKKRNLAPARLPSSRKEFDVSDLTKPDFWAEQAPATIALYLAGSTGGAIGGSAATSLAARFGLSGKAAQVAKFAGQIFGGTIPMTGAEAFMEASGTYNQALESMLQSGKSEKESQEKASEAAASTFTSNLTFLAGTNAFEYYTALGKLPRGLRSKFTRYVVSRAKNAGIERGGRRALLGALNIGGKGVAAATESAEEVIQGWIQQTAQDYVEDRKPDAGLEIKDLLTKIEEMKPDTQAEILVGLGMGLLFQAGGSFDEYMGRRKKLERKARTNPQELKRDIESIINEEERLKESLNIPKTNESAQPESKVAAEVEPAQPVSAAQVESSPQIEVAAPPSQPTVAPALSLIPAEGAGPQPQEIEPEVEAVDAEPIVDGYEGLRLAIEQKKAEAQEEGRSGFNADDLDLSILDDDEVKSLYRSMAVEMAIPGKDDLTDIDRAAVKEIFDARGTGIEDADIENAMNLRRLLRGSRGRGKFAKKVIDEMMTRPALRKKEPKRLQSGVRAVAKREQSYLIPVKSIQTDEDRFQLRKTPYSEETAQKIAEDYDPEKFEPIVVWQEEGDAKPFVLSGHSRLEGMKRRGEKLIPAKIFEGTEQEAMAVAAAESMENTPKAERKDDVVRPRATPQIKSKEGAHYVLPSFASHGARKGGGTKQEKAPKSITKQTKKFPPSLAHGNVFISAVDVDRVEQLYSAEAKAALRALEGDAKQPRTPQEIDSAILERTLELEQSGASVEDMRNDPVLKSLDKESREAYAENERARRKLFGQKEPEGEFDVSTEAIGEDIDKLFSSLDYDSGKSDIVPESAPSVDDLTKTLKKQKQVEVTGRDGGSLTYAIKDVHIGDTDAGKKLEISRTSDGTLVKELGVNEVAGLAVGSPVKELLESATEEMKVQLALFEDEQKDEATRGEEKKSSSRKQPAKSRRADKADRGSVRAGTEAGGEGLSEAAGVGTGEGATPERVESATGVVESTTAPTTVLPVFRIKDLVLDYKNTLSRFRDNLAALKVLHELRASRMPPTEQQQSILSKYVGWGGLAQAAFDESSQSNIAKYATEREQLKRLLTTDELKSARASTINAHYTSYPIVRSMWNALQHFGFNGGKVLEPGSGIGNFAGLVPDALLEKTKLTGVEMDNISVEISRHLYPNNTFLLSPFQDVGFQENTFDAVIGNVPFGNVPIYDPALEKRVGKSLSIHNYFIYKSITLLKPGGIAAVITSRYTMDAKTNSDFRKSLGEIANLVGAVRLPAQAFQSNAATEVVTDILFFRKRDNSKIEKSLKAEFEKTGKTNFYGTKNRKYVEFEINEYFIADDNMIYGSQNDSGKMQFGNVYNVEKLDFKDSKVEADLGNLVSTLPRDIFTPKEVAPVKEKEQRLVDLSLNDRTRARNGSIVEADDELLVVTGFDVESGKSKVEPFAGTAKDAKIARGVVAIKRAIFDVYDTQQSLDATEEDVAKTIKQLNASYDSFVSKNGFLHERANASVFSLDPDAPHLYALESYDPETKKATKADIFSRRVIEKRKVFTSAASPVDALAISMNEKGKVDVDRIAQLLNVSIDEAAQKLESENLIFRNPGSGYESVEEYLSGDVVTKLEVARNAVKTDESFSRNVKALEAVQPKIIPAERIYVSPGAAWIPLDIYTDFFSHLMNFNMSPHLHISRDTFDNGYKVSVSSRVFSDYNFDDTLRRSQWGTYDIPAEEIFENILNSKQPTVNVKAVGGGTVLDEAKTAEVRVRARQMIQEFSEWIMNETTRRERVTAIFNDRFNRLVPRDYHRSGNILTFDGMTPAWRDKLHQHQKDGIYRALFGNTLFNVVVGGGKTNILIGTAMEAKRIGIAKKPILVVKKNTLLQFRSDFLNLYPSAKILVADDVNFTKAERQKFLTRIATGNWDAIIITHSAFGFIPMSEQFQSKFYRDIIAEMIEALEPMKKEHGSRDRTVKEIEKRIQTIEAKIEKLADMRKDDLITFEQLGIDMMLVDEAHNFKNLFFVSKHRDVLGLGKRDGGKKTFDMFMKTQYLAELNGGERGVVFATGTPVENSLSELYHILRYLKPRTLKQLGLTSFDAFASTFAEATVEVERKATGQYKPTLRFMKFRNLLQLSTLNSTFMEVKTLNDLPALKQIVPARKGGKAQVVEAPRSDEMAWYMEFLYQRAKNLKKAEEGSDNHLVIATDARKAALSLSMVASGYRTKTPTKIDYAIDRIFETWKEGAADRSAQLIFCDLGVPFKAAKKEGAVEPDEESPDFDSGFESESKPGVEYIGAAIVAITRRKKGVDKEKLNYFFNAVARTEKGERYSVYDEIKNALVRKGIPKEQIVFVQDFKTDEQKKQMQAKVREGKYRVVLASTSTFGEGTNVQARLAAIHHLDIPWTPAKLEQRNGRGFRMGNMFLNKGGVYEFRYVTLDSHDAVMWQKIEQKAHFTESFFVGAQQEMEDIMSTTILDAAEMRSIATGNHLFKRFIELRIAIDQLQAEEKAHKSKVFRAQRDLESIPKDQIVLRGKLVQYEHIQDTVDATNKNETFKLGDESFEKRTELSEKLVEIMTSGKSVAAVLNNGGKLTELARGEWKGISFNVTGEYGGNQYGVIFKISQKDLPGQGYIHYEKKVDATTPEGINAFFRKNRDRVEKLIEGTKLEMAKNEKALVTVKEIAGQKFKRAEELRSSLSEIEVVTASLNQSEEAAEDADVPAELRDESTEAAFMPMSDELEENSITAQDRLHGKVESRCKDAL